MATGTNVDPAGEVQLEVELLAGNAGPRSGGHGGRGAFVPLGRASGDGYHLDVFGVLYERQHVTAEFALHGPLHKRREIVETVLASWQWK